MNIAFLVGSVLGNTIYLLHTKVLYGVYTYNPADLFLAVEARLLPNYERFFDFSRFGENIIFILDSFFKICFGQEFGIFYFSPILFLGFVMILHLIYLKKFSLASVLLLTIFIPIMGVVVLQNTAFSYGFRYLFSLIPIFIILYFVYFKHVAIYKFYIINMSIFGFLGVLFLKLLSFQYFIVIIL